MLPVKFGYFQPDWWTDDKPGIRCCSWLWPGLQTLPWASSSVQLRRTGCPPRGLFDWHDACHTQSPLCQIPGQQLTYVQSCVAASVICYSHVQHWLPLCFVSASNDLRNPICIAMTHQFLSVQDFVHPTKEPIGSSHSLWDSWQPKHAYVERICRYSPLPPSWLLLVAHQRRPSNFSAQGYRTEGFLACLGTGHWSLRLTVLVSPLGATSFVVTTRRRIQLTKWFP
jgi:hypothetical protein